MARTRHRHRGRSRQEVGVLAIEALRGAPEGLTKSELVRMVGDTTPQTMQRALTQLANDEDAPLRYDRSTRRWKLSDSDFCLPLLAPEPDDLTAVLLAEAILTPLADAGLRSRLRRLAEQLDMRLRRRQHGAMPPRGSVTASLTLGTPVDPVHLGRLLDAIRRQVLRITYYSPWQNRREPHSIEPWGVRVHDGTAYLRAYSREAEAPRTFRLVHVEEIVDVPGGRPSKPVPVGDALWGDGDPAFGIDEDRPDTAVLHVRGQVARWLAKITWHPHQRDRWLEAGELLERTVPYRSCREMARRVLSVLDAIEHIEPKALHTQVEHYVETWRKPS